MTITETLYTKYFAPPDEQPPTNLKALIVWLEGKLAEIPEPFQNSAEVDLTPEEGYDGIDENFIITFERPPSDEEREQLEQRQRRARAEERARDLAALAELKAKYPDR